jgi:electron transfer flavoprotein alpha subunit
MKTLVWVEHDGSAVKDATLAAVTAARSSVKSISLVAGSGVDGVAKEAAQIAGVQKVLSPMTPPSVITCPKMSRRSSPT